MPTRGTQQRPVRVSDDLWKPALAKAQEKGETLSAVIRRALERYLAEEEDTST
jgi:predicted DNA-binding protein